MKKALFEFFSWMLRRGAKFVLWRFRPMVVAITGSSGKSMVKEAAASLFAHSEKFSFRTTPSNFPAYLEEHIIPFAIIGLWKEEDMDIFESADGAAMKLTRGMIWIRFGFVFFWRMISASHPQILILDLSIARERTFRKELSLIRPDIVIVTMISDPPPHTDVWNGSAGVLREKGRLLEQLGTRGTAVLNYDDKAVFELKERTRARIISFGFDEGADARIIQFENKFESDRRGVSFKLEYGGSVVPFFLHNVFGKAEAYCAAAAACLGLIFGLNLVEISEALLGLRYSRSVGLHLVSGIKGTFILDASYHSSGSSAHEGLHILHDFPGTRKVAVLGDMLWLGKEAIETHHRIGRRAGQICDVLITVGPRGRFIAESAHEGGIPSHMIYACDTVSEAGKILQSLMKKGDVVLIMGSKEMRLEKAVEEVKA